MNKDFFWKQGLMQTRMETWTAPENTNPTKSQLMTNFFLPPPPNQSQALGKNIIFNQWLNMMGLQLWQWIGAALWIGKRNQEVELRIFFN